MKENYCRRYLKYLSLILLFFAQSVYAQCKFESSSCVPVGEWNFSIGIGGGLYTNPLYDSDDVPLVIVPQVSYYGEKLFFDNNTLGFTFLENENLAISVITLLNIEKAFFERWHPHNVFIPNASHDSLGAEHDFIEDTGQKLSPRTVQTRDWALDAGLQLNWFISDTMNAELRLVHDVSNVYEGFNANLNVSKVYLLSEQSLLEVGGGFQWNSTELVDYYYGIQEQDIGDRTGNNLYSGSSSVNPYVTIVYNHQLNEEWKFKAQIKRKKLGSNTYSSPLVNEQFVDLIFVGFFYEF
jgi:outer membrane protein